jgi:antitoxin component of MazEF toxin-antitoxin module
MIKKLTKHGNSYALVIDKPILELLKIDPDTPLEVTTDGTGLRIEPASDEIKVARVTRVMNELDEQYGGMMRRLAE